MDTLTYKDAAAEFPNVAPATFRRWKCKGKLKPVDFDGRTPRFARADIEACVANHKPELNGNVGRIKKAAACAKATTLFNPDTVGEEIHADMPADARESRDNDGEENFEDTNGTHAEEDENMENNNAQGGVLAADNDNVETPADNSAPAVGEENLPEKKEIDNAAESMDSNEKILSFKDNLADNNAQRKLTVEEARAMGLDFESFMANQLGLTREEYVAKVDAEIAEEAARAEKFRRETIESFKSSVASLAKDIAWAVSELRDDMKYAVSCFEDGRQPPEVDFEHADAWGKDLAKYLNALEYYKNELAELGVDAAVVEAIEAAGTAAYFEEKKIHEQIDSPDANDGLDTPADSKVTDEQRESPADTGKLAPVIVDVTVETPPFPPVNVMTLDERAERIRQLVAGVGYNVIQIGFELTEAKKQCGHGHWAQWLKKNFAWTQQTAANYMRISERFGDGKLKNVFQFGLSTLNALTALPAGEENKFIEAQAASGKPVEEMTARETKRAVREFKQSRAGVVVVIGGQYFNATGSDKNAATVDELNAQAKTETLEVRADDNIVKTPETNETVLSFEEKPATPDTDNGLDTPADSEVTDEQLEAQRKTRVEEFTQAVKAQLAAIRATIEETRDADTARAMRDALLNLVKDFALSLKEKIS